MRSAVIGAGLMARVHARAAMRAGASVEAVADTDIAKARALAKMIGPSCVAMNVDDLLVSRGGGVLHVCTPPAGHFAISHAALGAGFHVICEKPLAQTADEVESLVSLAHERRLQLCPVHQFPFQRGVREIVENAGRIGRVRHVRAEICTAGAEGMTAGARHQVALDILPHPLSLFALFAAGPLRDVDWKVSCASHGEIAATGVSGGVVMSLLLSTAGRPTGNSLRVIGESATATADLFHGFAVIESGRVSRLRKMARPFVASGLTLGHAAANGMRRGLSRETDFPGLRDLVRRFHESVNGGPSPIPGETIRDIAIARDILVSLAAIPD